MIMFSVISDCVIFLNKQYIWSFPNQMPSNVDVTPRKHASIVISHEHSGKTNREIAKTVGVRLVIKWGMKQDQLSQSGPANMTERGKPWRDDTYFIRERVKYPRKIRDALQYDMRTKGTVISSSVIQRCLLQVGRKFLQTSGNSPDLNPI